MAEHRHTPRPRGRVIDGDTLERAAALFRALGDPARLALLEELRAGERCVSELAKGEGLSGVSQRLRLLKAERLVEKRREGKHIFYRLADAHVFLVIDAVLAHAREDA